MTRTPRTNKSPDVQQKHLALAQVLSGYRALYGVSQRESARLAHLSVSSAVRIESGHNRPTPESLWRLSGAVAGEERHDERRWKVLMAAAWLRWPEPAFHAVTLGMLYDPDMLWRLAEQSAEVWQRVPALCGAVGYAHSDAVTTIWQLYQDRGAERWPRWTSAGQGNGAVTVWFDLLCHADREGQEAVAKLLADPGDADPDVTVLTAKGLWEVWSVGGKKVVHWHKEDAQWGALQNVWHQLSPRDRRTLLTVGQAIVHSASDPDPQ